MTNISVDNIFVVNRLNKFSHVWGVVKKAPRKKSNTHKENRKVTDPAFCVAFGAHVRKLREESGTSLRQFANKIDVDYNQMFRVEHGLVNTSISMALAIAIGLNISVSELFNFKYSTQHKK